MPKKKKDRKKSGLVYDPDAKKRLKQLRAFNWRRFGLLILSTLAAFAVLEVGITLEAKAKMSFSVVTIIYYVIVTALAAAVVILNHGFSKKPFTRDMIREDEAERILDKLNRRKGIAKKLMPVLIPFIFAILLDFMYLFYGDILKKIFGFLVS